MAVGEGKIIFFYYLDMQNIILIKYKIKVLFRISTFSNYREDFIF